MKRTEVLRMLEQRDERIGGLESLITKLGEVVSALAGAHLKEIATQVEAHINNAREAQLEAEQVDSRKLEQPELTLAEREALDAFRRVNRLDAAVNPPEHLLWMPVRVIGFRDPEEAQDAAAEALHGFDDYDSIEVLGVYTSPAGFDDRYPVISHNRG